MPPCLFLIGSLWFPRPGSLFSYFASGTDAMYLMHSVFSLAVTILYNIARYISIGTVDKNIVRYMCKIYIAHYNGDVVY